MIGVVSFTDGLFGIGVLTVLILAFLVAASFDGDW